jgi:predicted small secreted protein
MRILIVVISALVLAACANTGAMKIGKDTYSISVRVPFSGPSGAKGEALKDANAFCAKQNKQVLLQNEKSYECALHGGCGEAEIIFLCLDENDPRYAASPKLRKDNGVTTVEVR